MPDSEGVADGKVSGSENCGHSEASIDREKGGHYAETSDCAKPQ